MMFMSLSDTEERQEESEGGREIDFYCFRCGASLQASSGSAGKTCECVCCSQAVPVPSTALKDPIGMAEKYGSEILAVEIEFLCPECRRKLVVEASEGAVADCAWCARRIDVPQLSSLSGYTMRPARDPAGPAVAHTRPALLTQEELEFLTAP